MIEHRHDVLLRGVQLPGVSADARPLILKRTDQSFIPAILDDLRAGESGLTQIGTTIARKPRSLPALKLYQPVHRIFYVALLEVSCIYFDNAIVPRLHPSHIESMGLVIRRLATDDQGNLRTDKKGEYVYEGWQMENNQFRGWLPFPNAKARDRDPDPAYREMLTLGDPALDERLPLARRVESMQQESIAPLFVAPQDACEAAEKTVLYGVLPLTSTEISEAPAAPAFENSFVRSHMPHYLRQGDQRALPYAGTNVNFQLADIAAASAANRNPDNYTRRLQYFMTLLRQVVIEFDMLGSSPASLELRRELNNIRVPQNIDASRTIGAGDFIEDAAAILLERAGSNQSPPRTLTMPPYWPAISQEQADRLRSTVRAAMEQRLAELRPGEGRFVQPNRLYVVRAFVRVHQREGCPPELFWSAPSEPFTIAPWHDSSEQPPVQITLPNPFDRNALRSLKPNVAFVMPSPLFDFLNTMDGEKMLNGEGNRPETLSVDLDWLCGFNIPIITLVAFILLNILLQLLNIIFWWLPFVKICIPFPTSDSNG